MGNATGSSAGGAATLPTAPSFGSQQADTPTKHQQHPAPSSPPPAASAATRPASFSSPAKAHGSSPLGPARTQPTSNAAVAVGGAQRNETEEGEEEEEHGAAEPESPAARSGSLPLQGSPRESPSGAHHDSAAAAAAATTTTSARQSRLGPAARDEADEARARRTHSPSPAPCDEPGLDERQLDDGDEFFGGGDDDLGGDSHLVGLDEGLPGALGVVREVAARPSQLVVQQRQHQEEDGVAGRRGAAAAVLGSPEGLVAADRAWMAGLMDTLSRSLGGEELLQEMMAGQGGGASGGVGSGSR